ncbi:hypothetical protein CXG81DRAFT_13527 [Caulochytrium protostelioides]|uniref:V-type proton ATPase subunit C n=1 Tax=Caulochytrium protostelioides TaxID=1555241 RepID=A0A4P9X5B0_9FUNG|nr:hypothetical protein CXG81DRAFT_13527 [Caulochytrium protostelioides]|eukprot:RKP00200.1 hypothetical protein CXG81DRAFT_13527 [Caulochytrium protostelioides]
MIFAPAEAVGPGKTSRTATVNRLQDALSTKPALASAAQIHAFPMPDFKVGTLDALVVLSDDVAKADAAHWAAAVKVADNLRTLLGDGASDGRWEAYLQVDGLAIDEAVCAFRWNAAKYRVDGSLREILNSIQSEVASVDTLVKTKMQQYAQIKGRLQAIQRKQTGNLAVKALDDLVRKDMFVLGSEYLSTVLVAVPTAMEKEWYATYETLAPMVVPRSSVEVAQDDEYRLFTVTLFSRVIDEFAAKAREKKFLVRDFVWDEQALAAAKREAAEVAVTEKETWTTLVRLCKTNFGTLYSAALHTTALRAHIEAVLRYGVPPDFQAMMLAYPPAQDAKVGELLNTTYASLAKGPAVVVEENMQHLLGGEDYSPVVQFPVSVISR